MTDREPTTDGAPADARRHTEDLIRRLAAEFHARLPRERARAVGAAYARYSSRFQDSILDQVRSIFEDALRKGVFIPAEHVFFDLAVRGCKSDREGLNALRDCLGRRAAAVAFFFATNRLFRKVYRSLQFVEEQLVEKGVRAVFVKSGVDTAEGKRWRGLLNMHAMMDEFVVGMTADHVRAAHEGLLEKRLVFGTISFGYAGAPLEGQTTRRGRPRMALAVDPVAGPWVERVFEWYVVERLPVSAIVRRLNAAPAAPPPPKAPGRAWSYGAVRRLLANPRYRGRWPYGATETVWVSSKDYARQVEREAPLKEVQIEALRIVPDDRWFAAQALLAQEAARAAGRKPRDGDKASRPRVLNGLFFGPAHGRKLYVGGVHGRYMVCRDCRGLPAESRPLFSQLPRALALRKTCAALAALVRADADLVGRVAGACRRYAAELQAPDPARATELEARLARLDRRIKFILNNPGDTDADLAESEAELRRLRKERAEDQARLDALRAAAGRAIAVPSDAEVAAMVGELESVLVASAEGAVPGAAGPARELIDRLTGGRIDLEQAGEPLPRRGWLRGQFRCRLAEALTGRLTGVEIATEGGCRAVVVDYRAEREAVPEDVAAAVVAHYEAGVLEKEIARRLGLPRGAVTRVLDAWDAARGAERPDGRSRRAGLAVKHTEPPEYQRRADPVKALADAGRPFGAIADELGVDRNTVTAAWRHWHESRGLPAPDGRARRKALRLAGASQPAPHSGEAIDTAHPRGPAAPGPSDAA
jgi:hypothetical protein